MLHSPQCAGKIELDNELKNFRIYRQKKKNNSELKTTETCLKQNKQQFFTVKKCLHNSCKTEIVDSVQTQHKTSYSFHKHFGIYQRK